MVSDIFAALVGVLALVYAGISKYVQGRLVDRAEMEKMQAESKRLNEEFEKAKKANDKKRMDRIMQQQLEFLPKMNGVMFKQFRPMLAILVIFGVFMALVGMLDPFVKDDIAVSLTDDGKGCDMAAGDHVFSACFSPEGANYGKWTISAKAYEKGAEVGSNETYFIFNPQGEPDTYSEEGKGEGLALGTDRKEYYPGDVVTVTAIPANKTKGTSFIVPLAPPRELEVDRVTATVSNGTYFRVDLPLAIPVLNVRTIYQPYWWFILISLVSNLAIGFVMGRMRRKEGKK